MKDKTTDFLVVVGFLGLVFVASTHQVLFRASVLVLLMAIIYQLAKRG